MAIAQPDAFSIIYGSIALIMLIFVLIMSVKVSSGVKGQKWYKTFWNLKKIVLPAIDHIADTVSDIALIIEFYYKSEAEVAENKHISDYNSSQPNIIIFFILSVIILLVYRLKSAFVVYRITGNLLRSILQFFFDLELFRAIYINVKFDPTKTVSLFKYIRQDECFYESIPQSLLSIIYMIYSGGENNAIVYFSVFFSLKSFSDRYIAYDGMMFKPEANNHHFSSKSISKRKLCTDLKASIPFITRSLWRFCDIVSRLLMLCFVWTLISYVVFIILFIIEMVFWWFFLTGKMREWLWLFAFAVLMSPEGSTKEANWLYIVVPRIQMLRNVVLLAILYLFIFVEGIQCDSLKIICSNYQYRNDLIFGYRFNLVLFIVCNILLLISIILYTFTKNHLLENRLQETETIATDIWYPARAGNATDLLANLEYGSNVNTVDERNRSALHYAASRGHTEVIAILLSYGEALNVNCKDNRQWTALHFCVRYGYKNCKNMDGLNAILRESHKLDINLKTNKGETALILASKAPFPDDVNLKPVAKLLIEKSKEYGLKIDVNIKDDDGNNALYYWTQNDDEEMVKLLLDQGAKQDEYFTNKAGTNAIQMAQENNNESIVHLLQDYTQ